MSSPLLIAADPGQVGAALISTWGNREILEVSQTFRAGGPYQVLRARPAMRTRLAVWE
jgi:hypothetical protein